MSDHEWEWIVSSTSGNCVEVAIVNPDQIMVRDSKNPAGPMLQFTGAEWDAFLDGVERGEFNRD